MTLVGTIKLTAQQFLQLGQDPAGVRLELADGEVAVSPSPTFDHQFAVFKLAGMIDRYITKNDLGLMAGDVDTILGEYDVRRPDILYFAKERVHLIGDEAIAVAPDLCVEVISPSSVVIDRKQKLQQYTRAGVSNYWIVDPAKRTMEGYTLRGRKYALAGKASGTQSISLPPFEELAILLKDLWRPKR